MIISRTAYNRRKYIYIPTRITCYTWIIFNALQLLYCTIVILWVSPRVTIENMCPFFHLTGLIPLYIKCMSEHSMIVVWPVLMCDLITLCVVIGCHEWEWSCHSDKVLEDTEDQGVCVCVGDVFPLSLMYYHCWNPNTAVGSAVPGPSLQNQDLWFRICSITTPIYLVTIATTTNSCVCLPPFVVIILINLTTKLSEVLLLPALMWKRHAQQK